MRIALIVTLIFGSIICLSSCNTAQMDDVAFDNMVKEKWQERKVIIMDSMNSACADRMQNKLNAAVDSVLTKRGIDISK